MFSVSPQLEQLTFKLLCCCHLHRGRSGKVPSRFQHGRNYATSTVVTTFKRPSSTFEYSINAFQLDPFIPAIKLNNRYALRTTTMSSP